MIRNLKTLGMVLLAVSLLGALGAQTAQGEGFHFDGESTVLTGKNSGTDSFQIGAAGTLECTSTTLESTAVGDKVSEGTWESDEITARPNYSGCTFGGQKATVFVNDCAYVLYPGTTAGNPTGEEHANLTIECSENNVIKIHTANCTVTVGPQEIADAVRYEPDTTTSISVSATAHEVVVGKERNTSGQPVGGCTGFPTGAVGELFATSTVECLEDKGSAEADPTTPEGTEEGKATECSYQEPSNSVLTGKQVGSHKFTVGAVGTIECSTATFATTIEGNIEEEGLPAQRTVKPSYSGCTFGGQPAPVKVNDCAYVLDSGTTEGNTTGGKHANFEIECAEGHKIEIHTVNCTVTFGAQTVKHAIRYLEDTATSFTMNTTAHGIVVGKARTTEAQPANGCLLFPTGAVQKLIGTSTVECLKDSGPAQENPTTPGATEDGEATECSPE